MDLRQLAIGQWALTRWLPARCCTPETSSASACSSWKRPPAPCLWSHTAQVRLDDLFQVQDSVSSAVVEALALPLSSREQRMLRQDVPASAEAYGFYLRANRLSAYSAQWTQARDFYRRAVEADPSYAPPGRGSGDACG